MKRFRYVDAKTLDEAAAVLRHYNGDARIIAGGTDLLGQLKNRIHPSYPSVLVDIKSISGLRRIEPAVQHVTIGALATINHVADNACIQKEYAALAQAARATASPHIRWAGTLGGNLCQGIRCWYYRAPKNYFYCLRKAGAPKGSICYAVRGDNRVHSIFGPVKKCFAVHPSDMAPAVVALNARFKTTERLIDAQDFFAVGPDATSVSGIGEILTEIQIPRPQVRTKSCFMKFALRKTIDFPIVNCAVAVSSDDDVIKLARICLNGVYNLPYRPTEAETFLAGQRINEKTAATAGELTVAGAKPLSGNGYMVLQVKDLVEKSIMACS